MSQHTADTLPDRADLDEALFGEQALREAFPSYPDPVPLPEPDPAFGALDAGAGYEFAEEPQPVALQCGGGSYTLADVAPGVFEMRETVLDPAPEPPSFVPRVATLGNLSVQAGENAPVTGEVLTLAGAAPPVIDLMLCSPPAQGTLLREGFALTGGDAFTQEDIDQGRILYRHEGEEAGEDSFGVATPCGTLADLVIRVYIDPPPHAAPVLEGPGDLGDLLAGCPVSRLCPVGIAVVALAGRGEWQFDGQPMGEVQHG
ncbi:MAG: hypothetical protein K2W96_14150, partial [Gemmataceae bacterium]|nr:hypothetical protein [Gemmataceae bacterium]